MNARKTLFLIGGPLLIILILGYRFNWFSSVHKVFKEAIAEEKAIKQIVKSSNKKTSNTKPVKMPPGVITTDDPADPIVPEPVSNAVPAPAVSNPAPAAKAISKSKDKSAKHEKLGIGDPFNYSVSGIGEFSPGSGGKPVGIITVKGIIRLKGQEPMAILHIKDSERSYYVKRGNVIRINAQAKTGNLIKEAYIIVKEVRDDEVEVVQQERPDKVIIIR